ncbi:SGS domain-containing protein, partial [Aphelenchoides avenae]
MVVNENGVQCTTRYDWYQTESAVIVTILKRGLSVEQCSVDISDGCCTVDAGGETIFTAKLLHDVDEERVTLTCTPSK